ncbi:methyl-accepting chemotaxis protein [Bacillus sp. Marseille-P3661]|uniref:methyl-accepting chemotaxis protein n=1 Tax=Bacillus sp. Marseille-P3661 TaxID=1936234 RepID=UPI000C852191|nr:HAMP domain-containing methyl-accepting chemotaxis protein [Bacillus sp. Marseille-P3661]
MAKDSKKNISIITDQLSNNAIQRSLRTKLIIAIVISLLISSPISAYINSYVKQFVDGNFGVYINTIITLLVSTLIILLFVKFMIINPLQKLIFATELAAAGDLTVSIEINTKDEMNQLARSFNKMIHNLSSLVQKANETAFQVATQSNEFKASAEQNSKAIEQISVSIGEVVEGSEIQVNHATELKNSATDISQDMEQSASSIQMMDIVSKNTNEKADSGSKVVMQTIEQMNKIQQSVKELETVIDDLGSRSHKINEIVGIITQIAEQTNLLALNAAIEAARAGDHGKGFAVVADEVRKLAEQSGQAAGTISELTKEIQTGTATAVHSMKNGTTIVEKGIEMVNQTGKVFDEIVANILDMTMTTKEVSATVHNVNSKSQNMRNMIEDIVSIAEQTSGSTQHVAAAIEQQTASMEEIAATSVILSKLSTDLQNNINEFKIV